MAAAGRVFDQGRKEQGFRSQAHLDAFYRYYDHYTACGACGQPGRSYLTEDNGWQPTVTVCPAGRELDAAAASANFAKEETR